MTLKEAYNYGVYFLSANGVDEAEFKSLCLVCHLDGISNSEYSAHKDDDIIMKRFADLLWRVKSGEPLQYVIGKWDFYESEFYVGPGVLIPRPETEELVELALESIDSSVETVIYDLCSGSGCIGISLAKKLPKAKVYLLEKSEEAFQYLKKNCRGVENAFPVLTDISNADIETEQPDVIISNPPYIPTSQLPELQAEVQKEPSMALDGGEDGLDFYRIIKNVWFPRLALGGRIFLEIGEDQGEKVLEMFSGCAETSLKKDIYGNDRMITAVKTS